MERIQTGTWESPVGTLHLVRSSKGLMRLDFSDAGTTRLLESNAFEWAGNDIPQAWTAQLEAYFCGERTAFEIPLDLRGTPFSLSVWQALQRIPYGRTHRPRRARLPQLSRNTGIRHGSAIGNAL